MESRQVQPSVTAVLVTGKDDTRRALAACAIEDFRRQTYARRSLLVINDAGTPWFLDQPDVRELVLAKRHSLGELRNLGTDHADGDLVIQWDDDDRYREDRIAYQVALWRPTCCVVLRRQAKIDLTTGASVVCDRPRGIEGTILYPRHGAPRYPAQSRSEDTSFFTEFSPTCRIVADNDPEIYTRQYHGTNTWHRDHVMLRD